MRILALDIGQTRTGLAISDPLGRVASPLCVLKTHELTQLSPSCKKIFQDWEPELLLVGLPLSLSGEEGPQCRLIKDLAYNLSQKLSIELQFFDERYSSKEAKQLMHEMGMSEKDMRGKLDMLAASIFLQAYLDSTQMER